MFVIFILLNIFIWNSQVHAENNKEIYVTKNKVWIVAFNYTVKLDQAAKAAIKVIDSDGKNVNVSMELGNYKNIVYIKPPAEGYDVGKSYQLTVDRGIVSEQGNYLDKTNSVNFHIVEDGANTSGNLSNGGLLCENNGWIYFLNASDNGKLYKIKSDNSDMTKLSDDSPLFINVEGNWIYYSNCNDGNKLYKIHTDGTERTKITDDSVGSINAVNGIIYYSNQSDNEKLYKINADGTGKIKVYDNSVNLINVIKDTIYYININDDRKLYTMNIDGTGGAKLCEDKVNCFCIYDGCIYYSNMSDDCTLYKVRLDGNGKRKLNDTPCSFINTVNNLVYYADISQNNKLSKISIYGYEESETSFVEDNLNLINYAASNIFFQDNKENKIIKMDPNTNNKHVFGRVINNIDDINVKVSQESEYILPKNVDVVFADGTKDTLDVKWNVGQVNTSIPGKYTYEGTVEGYNKKLHLNITVLRVINAENIFQSRAVGTNYQPPSTINVNLEGGYNSKVPVLWSTPEGFDVNKPGKYTFEGTIAYYDKKVYCTVNIVQKDILPSNTVTARKDGWIYYTNKEDDYYIYKIKEDGTSNIKLIRADRSRIRIFNGNIYYIGDQWNLYKTTTDGKLTTKISNDFIHSFDVYNDKIYYSASDGIYKINSDGTGKTLVVGNTREVQSDYIFVYNDYIYYIPIYDWQIYRVKIDGTDKRKISKASSDYVYSMAFSNGYIYYNYMNSKGLRKINTLDLSDTMVISDLTPCVFGVENNYIYYSKFKDNHEVYKISTDGTGEISLTPKNQDSSFSKVDNGWVYFEDYSDDRRNYRIRTDGTDEQIVVEW